MDTKLIFDAATKPIDWVIVWSPLFACAFASAGILIEKFGLVRHSRFTRFSCLLMLVGGVVSAIYFPLSWYYHHVEAAKKLNQGLFDSVQGVVSDFTKEDFAQNTPETFTISGHKFIYRSASVATPCFSQTSLQHGPIHPQMVLRIKFSGDCILRIDQISEE